MPAPAIASRGRRKLVSMTDGSVSTTIEYLNWSERVVAGCRGTNDALERHYDEVLKKGRATLAKSE